MLLSIKLHYCILLILSFLNSNETFQRGLKFKGGEQTIDKRTSYNVFDEKKIAFQDSFNIELNLSLYSTTQIGYIVRIKNKESDKVFNLFYTGYGNDLIFKFNEEGRNCLIVASINKEELPFTDWFKMKISFDLQNDSILLTIHNKTFSAGNVNLPDTYFPIILFGKSDHIIDVPSFAIKDLLIGNKERYYFALKENEGNIVHDINGKPIGKVANPEWLINDAYHWKHKVTFESESPAGANYNPKKKEVYYFNRDSIYIYNVRSEVIKSQAFENKCPVKLTLGTNFIDKGYHNLYAYEVFLENENEVSTVANLELSTYRWTPLSNDRLPTQLHHHGSYFDPSSKEYTIFGGFGNMHYSKYFYSFSLDNKEWHSLEGFSGDLISPRYFSSVGYLEKANCLYIFGGMGNESGEQTVGRKYYYDLYKVDLNTKHITKLWEIPWDKDNVVPVRGMVILNDSCFCTFCYPEHFTNSFLRLYQFSLTDGSYEVLGDSIPIYSDKIATNANLYYDSGLNNLYALVQEFDDDIASDLKVYSLAFPPVTAEKLASYSKPNRNNSVRLILLLSLTIVVIVGYFLCRSLKSGRYTDNQKGVYSADEVRNTLRQATKPNSIYLFGDFAVRDRKNRDITYMFSSRLKQLLCLVLHHSTGDGISSQLLGSILWPGKPSDKIKNSRGVAINNLRKVLNELDGVELIYEKGCFKIAQTAELYCDYFRCIQFFSANEIEENREELLEILSRGKFLKHTDHILYDSFKEKMEQKLEPLLLLEMQKCFQEESYRATIDLAKGIFNIDPLNNQALNYQIKALKKLKMNDEARLKYHTFVMEYKKLMGTDYPHQIKV